MLLDQIAKHVTHPNLAAAGLIGADDHAFYSHLVISLAVYRRIGQSTRQRSWRLEHDMIFELASRTDRVWAWFSSDEGDLMGDAETELFERLGGSDSLLEIVEEMYRRVLDDAELAPFFQHVSMDRLHRMQFQFLASAFDGPINYSGAELSAIHRKHRITASHFARFCGHFADVLESRAVSPRDIDDALGRLATFKDKVTGEANLDG